MTLNDLYKTTENFKQTDKMPVLFLGHGSPMNAIEENEFTQGWSSIGRETPAPNAILTVSAHWETNGTFVTINENPRTIHDFGGFPEELFNVQYPAPGSPELASEIINNVKAVEVKGDDQWGLDHGTWSVIKHLYPAADIPVVQMSLDYRQSPQYHYNLAKELASLRRKGVLIVGSGNIVHNLRMAAWNRLSEQYGYDWAIEADEKIKQFILNGEHQRLINFHENGQAFRLAIPSPEHYIPLLYIIALQEKEDDIKIFNDKPVAGSLTMTSLKFG